MICRKVSIVTSAHLETMHNCRDEVRKKVGLRKTVGFAERSIYTLLMEETWDMELNAKKLREKRQKTCVNL